MSLGTGRKTRCNNLWRKPEKKSCKTGFTLIELLVVIAIIPILAAILLPVLSKSKEAALAVACLNNTKELGIAIKAYCDENGDYFPQVTPWWTVGPYTNKHVIRCGGEWFQGGFVPNTIAPMLSPYVQNDLVWVCPKRRRGLSYVVNGQVQGGLDPSITGFLSYGFNKIGVFGGPDPTTGMMTGNIQKFKAANCRRPSDIVSICDVSGSNDPLQTHGDADACWLDTVWASESGPGFASGYPPGGGSFNYRVQTAYAKHDIRLSFLSVDGHAATSYPSRLTWGNFWGVFDPTVALKAYGGVTYYEYMPISTPAYDPIQWSGLPE